MLMIEDFLNYLRYERNRSDLTVRNYERSLRDFESYFKNRENHLSWESVDSDLIRDWMESMMDKGDMASTVNNCLSAVRSFFRFALSRGLVSSDPAHHVKGPKKMKPLPQFVREGEMDRLIDQPEMWSNSYDDLRARTIIILFYETGIRLAELVGLDDQDIDFVNRQLKVTGKGNYENGVQIGIEFGIMFAPAIILGLGYLTVGLTATYIFMCVLGLGFIVTSNLWLRNIYKRMMKRRYENIEGFHATRV